MWSNVKVGVLSLVIGLLVACKPFPAEELPPVTDDLDGDGFSSEVDCNDEDESVHPYAETDTSCNGVDEDCDGTDGRSEVWTVFFRDADADGWGDPTDRQPACEALPGYVERDGDCDDLIDAVNPDATELCNGLDDDCDYEIDNDAVDALLWHFDGDGDGYGDPGDTTTACEAEIGYVANGDDCNDERSATHPGSDETCNDIDDDCDGLVDESPVDPTTWYIDSDGDGYGDPTSAYEACDPAYTNSTTDGGDCDDSESNTYPGAPETCNENAPVDRNCDGILPYGGADTDGDGSTACEDCDDADASVHVGATEVCDGIDNDCDRAVDDDDSLVTGGTVFYADDDTDGFGDAAVTMTACDVPVGYVEDATDCDDAAVDVNTDATEVCDGIDNDCDRAVDDDDSDAAGLAEYSPDADGDGYGDPDRMLELCSAPAGYLTDATDCDDTNADAYPGNTETCDGVDNDCDTGIDETSVDTQTYYLDLDRDGFGDAGTSVLACTTPAGYVEDATDCDDANADVYPDAPEICDGIDNDCDDLADSYDSDVEGESTFWQDTDGDGYGNASVPIEWCEPLLDLVANDDDCNDLDATTHPAASETCDGTDEDCDGTIDDAATDASSWYRDTDSDGYGDATDTTASCSAPAGYVANDDDCDPIDSSVNPAASETCDGTDEDCDGFIDDGFSASTWYRDADSDGYGDPASSITACSAPAGYVANDDDCDDVDATEFPSAVWWRDRDADGYGDSGSIRTSCTKPSGYVSSLNGEDCDDYDAGTYPGNGC